MITISITGSTSDFVRACKGWYGTNGLKQVYELFYGQDYEEQKVYVVEILMEIIYEFNLLKDKHKFMLFFSEIVHPPVWRLSENSIDTILLTISSTIQGWQMSNRLDHVEYQLDIMNKELKSVGMVNMQTS